jgi:hypothetical protein
LAGHLDDLNFRESEEMATNTTVPAQPAARATDDEILGLTTNCVRNSGRASAGKKIGRMNEPATPEASPDDFFADLETGGKRAGDDERGSDAAVTDAEHPPSDVDDTKLNSVLEENPELRDAWHDAKAYREVFATPAEARAATKLLGDVNRMDALFFSRRPEDHAELARAVAQLDPQAFASLARAMSALTTGTPANTNTREIPGPRSATAVNENPRSGAAQRSDGVTANSSVATGPHSGLTAAQSDFFHSTNAAAVQGVMEAIETQVDRLLPEGISKSARNRVAGEIYRELDTTLQGNRALGQQMRDAFRSGALDDAHRKAIVSLVTGRARQALPGVAKRVLNEWTNTIVSANQDRRARQRTAERRVDISGSGGSNEGRRAVSSRDIDYGRMSDGDILNL